MKKANLKTEITPRSLYGIYLILMVLFLISWGVAYIPLGSFNTVLAFGISVVKTILIVLFFMEVRYAQGLIRLAVWVGTVWLSILLVMLLSDYLTRGLNLLPGK